MLKNKRVHTSFAALKGLIFCIVLLGLNSVAYSAPPTFSKSFNPSTIGPNSSSKLTFFITNDAFASTDLAFTDVLPVGVVVADAPGLENTCQGSVSAAPSSGVVSLASGRLPGNRSCSISVNVTSSTVGVHTNISGDLTSSEGNSGNATAELTVDAGRPGLSKSFSPSSVNLGDRATLTFVIDNSLNSSALLNVVFNDTLPNGVVIADPANLVTNCPGTITANANSSLVSYSNQFPFFAANTSCQISVDVTAQSGGLLENVSSELTATASSSFISAGFATATLAVNVTELNLTKEFTNDPTPPGGLVDLEFSITNRNRSSDASSVNFSDDLGTMLPGMVAVGLPLSDVCGTDSSISGTSVLSLADGVVAAGDTCRFTVQAQVPASAASGGYTNLTTVVEGNVAGSVVTGNAATDTLFVAAAPLLTKDFNSNPVGAGDTVVMNFSITNTDAVSPATNISFQDDLGQFMSGVGEAGNPGVVLPTAGTCGATFFITNVSASPSLSVTGGSLAAGETCLFDVEFVVPENTPNGIFTNTTSSISAEVDGQIVVGNPASASLTVFSAPILTKEFINDPVLPGDTVTLRFTIETDENGFDATQIAFTDDLESALTGLVATGLPLNDVCGAGSVLSGNSILEFTGGSLTTETSCTFDVELQVPSASASGNYASTASNVTALVGGVETVGLPAADTLTVAELELSKRFINGPFVPGGTAELEFTVSNNSLSDVNSILFTDSLSNMLPGAAASILPANDSCGAGSQLIGTSFLIFTGGNLLAGDSCSFVATVSIPTSAENGSYRNTTSAVTAQIDGQSVSLPGASAILNVNNELLSLQKAFSVENALPGDTVSLEFVVENLSSDITVTDITFTDDLEAALTGLVSTSASQTDVCGVGSLFGGVSELSLTGAELAPGAMCAFSVDVLIPTDASSFVNTTSDISGIATNGAAVNGTPASDSLSVISVLFSKEFADDVVQPNDTTALTFTIQNSGQEPIDRLFFTDNLDAVITNFQASGLPLSDVCGEGSAVTGDSIITFTGGTLDVGETCQFSVDVVIPNDASPGTFNNITSNLLVNDFAVSGPATDTITIDVPIVVAFSKAFDAETTPGGTTQLTFSIENNGLGTVSDISFTDDLSSALTGLVATDLPLNDVCGLGSSFSGTSTLNLTSASLASGESCQFSTTVQVPLDAVPDSYLNITSDLFAASTSVTDPATATLVVNDSKVEICHKPGTRAEKTLLVPQAALQAHLDHGDVLGACEDLDRVKICIFPGTKYQRERVVPEVIVDKYLRYPRIELGSCPNLSKRYHKVCVDSRWFGQKTWTVHKRYLPYVLRFKRVTYGACE